MNQLVLLISKGDWGDELELEGFAIYTKERWEYLKGGIPIEPFEAYYGSNEFVTFEGREDYLSYITEKEISEEEAIHLCELLGKKLTLGDFFEKYGYHYGLWTLVSDND